MKRAGTRNFFFTWPNYYYPSFQIQCNAMQFSAMQCNANSVQMTPASDYSERFGKDEQINLKKNSKSHILKENPKSTHFC